MANKQTVITFTHGNEAYQTVVNKLLTISGAIKQFQMIRNYCHAVAGGDRICKAVVQVNSGDAVAATGTVTFASFANNDTFTVGSETFTCKTSGASGNNQFNIGGTDTLSAAAAIVKVNAHPNLAQTISATSAGAVITVTAKVPGRIGNYIGLAISAHGSVSAATLTAGADAGTYSAQTTSRMGL